MSKQHPEPGEYFRPEPGETQAQARARAEAARKAGPQNTRSVDPTTQRYSQPSESLAQALARQGGRTGSQRVGRDRQRPETQEEAHARRNRTPEQQRAWESQHGTPQGPRHGETPEQFNARQDAERRL